MKNIILPPPVLRKLILLINCFLLLLVVAYPKSLSSQQPDCQDYNLSFENLQQLGLCGIYSVDIVITPFDPPLENLAAIVFSIAISNYPNVTVRETESDNSIHPDLKAAGLELDYKPNSGQLILREYFFFPIPELEIKSGENFIKVMTLYFELKPGNSTAISYDQDPLLIFDLNLDGTREECPPNNISGPANANQNGYTLSGEVETMNMQNYSCGELENVFIEFSNAGGVLCDDLTDAGGDYESCGLCPGGTYRVIPISGPLTDTLCGGAIDGSDITATQQHILGSVPFTYKWQYFAADCNGTLTVSTADLVVIQRAILHYPNPTLVPWTYWSKPSIDAIILPHPDPLGAGEQYWEFATLSENKTMKDFYGVRTMQVHLDGQACNCANNFGGVTGDRTKINTKTETFFIEDRWIQPGEYSNIIVKRRNAETLLGFDISLKAHNGIEIHEIHSLVEVEQEDKAETYKISARNSNARLIFTHVDRSLLGELISGDLIKVGVYNGGTSPVLISDMIEIDDVKGSNYIKGESNAYEPSQIELQFTEALSVKSKIFPNPIENEFVFWDDASWERLTLFDISGKALKVWQNPLAGQHYSVQDLTPGLYFLRFESNWHIRTHRVIKK